MGHEVIRIQECDAVLEDVVEKANRSDVFFWTRTAGQLNLDATKMLNRIKVPTATYHLDVFVGIEREKEINTNPFFKLDYFFQTDGDPITMQKFKELGVNAYYLPPVCSKEECYINPKVKEFDYDVVFVGSYNYHREWQYRHLLIDWLESVYGNRFHRFPDDLTGTIQGQKLNQLYASAKVVVGDCLCPGYTKERYWSNRVPETMGRGGVLIHPRIKGLSDFFQEGKEIILYDFENFDQLGNLINYYVYHTKEADEIRKNACNVIKEKFTFDNAIESMFEIMGLGGKNE